MASVIANCLYVLEFARETPTKRLLLIDGLLHSLSIGYSNEVAECFS